ncbi:hypothetical protein D9M68_664760 [compost metagenome]
MLVAEVAQAFEEAGRRRYAVHVAGHRLDDDAGDFLADVGQGLLHGFDVVERQGQGVLGEGRRHARGAGHAQGQGAGAGFHQQGVGVAVVAALELDDAVAAGVATGQADGAHGGFGAGADHAHHFHRRHQRADQIRHFHFQGGRRAIGQAVFELLAHRIQHVRVAVAEDHRAPGTHVVDIALVILVRHVGAGRMLEEQRRAADALEGADRRVDPAGDVFLGIGEQGFGTGHGRSLHTSGIRGQAASNRSLKARARRSTSAAEAAPNRAWITATMLAPRAISSGALSRLTPPMATIGRWKRCRACSSRSRVAAGAPGLVWES